MRFYTLLALASLFCQSLLAQKPRTEHPLEIQLAAESDASRMQGNMRISLETGWPKAAYQVNYAVTPADPETMARQYLLENRTLYGFSSEDLNNLKLHAISNRETGHTVRLRQHWQNLQVNKNAEVTVHVSPQNMVDFVMNGFQYDVRLGNVAPSMTATKALELLKSYMHIGGNISYEKADLQILHHQGNDYLIYLTTVASDSPVGEWEAFIDAKTGSMPQAK